MLMLGAPRLSSGLPSRRLPTAGHPGDGEQRLGVDFTPGAAAVTAGTAAEGRIEGDLPRLELRQREAADRAGEALRKHHRPGDAVATNHLPHDRGRAGAG